MVISIGQQFGINMATGAVEQYTPPTVTPVGTIPPPEDTEPPEPAKAQQTQTTQPDKGE